MNMGRFFDDKFEDIENCLDKDEPPTKDELISMLKKLSESDDYEVTHSLADDLIIRYINDEEIENAYNEVGKWYS